MNISKKGQKNTKRLRTNILGAKSAGIDDQMIYILLAIDHYCTTHKIVVKDVLEALIESIEPSVAVNPSSVTSP